MMKSFHLPVLIVFVSLISTNTSLAATTLITLPWSTTYDCGVELTQADWKGDWSKLCVGLSGGGGWTTTDGSEEQITVAANYTGGGGGMGQRHWEGDGVNNNSGGLRVYFANPEPELWIRWYLRYEAGFKWKYLQYDKWLYIKAIGFNITHGKAAIVGWYGGEDKFSINAQAGDRQTHGSADGHGWNTIQCGGGSHGCASDGSWHAYEVHIRMDTDGANGVAEGWIDGDKVFNDPNVDWGTEAGWVEIHIGENQRYPENGHDMYVDFDDIAVSNTGYIGPLSDNNAAPAVPTGLTKSQ